MLAFTYLPGGMTIKNVFLFDILTLNNDKQALVSLDTTVTNMLVTAYESGLLHTLNHLPPFWQVYLRCYLSPTNIYFCFLLEFYVLLEDFKALHAHFK